MIFLQFPAIAPDLYQNKFVIASPPPTIDLTCLYITHVCRRWRSVSLGCSSIWTCVVFKPPSWTPAFLKRARKAPLFVDVDWKRDGARHYIDDAVAQALDQLHHTRHLYLSRIPASFIDRMIATFKEQKVDMLEVLYVLQPDEEPRSLGVPTAPLRLADEIFAGPLRRLRQVGLGGDIIFSWRSQIFSAPLTSLSLNTLPPTSIPTMDQLLECLRKCPLETLLLQGCLPRTSTQTFLSPLPDGYVPVALPALRYFGLSDSSINVTDLVRRVRVSAACRPSFKNIHDWHVTTTVPTLESFALQAEHGLSSRPFLLNPALHIEHRNFNGCVWCFTSSEVLKQSLLSSPSGTLRMGSHYNFSLLLATRPEARTADEARRGMDLFAGVFSRVLPLYDLGSLCHLSIHSVTPFLVSIDSWLLLLRELQRVKTLSIGGLLCYVFASAFAFIADKLQMLPSLRNLEISHGHLSFPPGAAGLANKLEDAFTKRKTTGAPTWRLELKYCHVKPAQLQKLETASGQTIVASGDPDTWGIGANFDGEDIEGEQSEVDAGSVENSEIDE